MKLSQNFTLEELTKTNTGMANIPGQEALIKLTTLALMFLEPLRSIVAKPIKIISGYRSYQVNERVGGSDKSQHLKGEAVDIDIIGMERIDEFKRIASAMNFDQLIYEVDSNCMHVSYVSHLENRNEVLIRKVEDGKKIYYPYSKEMVIKLVKV
jgi:uncharacterized protein YcbK (DUF882 family)